MGSETCACAEETDAFRSKCPTAPENVAGCPVVGRSWASIACVDARSETDSSRTLPIDCSKKRRTVDVSKGFPPNALKGSLWKRSGTVTSVGASR